MIGKLVSRDVARLRLQLNKVHAPSLRHIVLDANRAKWVGTINSIPLLPRRAFTILDRAPEGAVRSVSHMRQKVWHLFRPKFFGSTNNLVEKTNFGQKKHFGRKNNLVETKF